jgi:hypothetical protein
MSNNRPRRIVGKIWLDNGNELGFEDYMTYYIAKAHYEKLGRVKYAVITRSAPNTEPIPCPTESKNPVSQ